MPGPFCRLAANGPREQVNQASAWIDASSIYGETEQIAGLFRAGEVRRHLLLQHCIKQGLQECCQLQQTCTKLGL